MKVRKMSTSWGNYLSGLFFGIFCANAARYFSGAEAVEKDTTTAIIIWSMGIVLYIILNIFTRPNVTKINGKEVDLCGVEIDTKDLSDDRIRVSVTGLEKRRKKEAFAIMDTIRAFCGSVRGDVDEV